MGRASTHAREPLASCQPPRYGDDVRRLGVVTDRRFLEHQLDALAGAADELTLVMQHGNVADWNVLVDDGGGLVLLDWEFSEDEGLPLWDLLFFLRIRAWPIVTGWRRRLLGRRRSRRDEFLRPGDTTVAEAIATYRRHVDVPAAETEYRPYTLGVGYGRVRVLTLEEFEERNGSGRFTFQDIIVVDEAPRDIEGVVGGVVTAEPQGDLSHVAVRTARRMTARV